MVSNEMTSTHGQLLEITCPGLSSWLCCSHVTSWISTTLNDRIITHVLIKSGALFSLDQKYRLISFSGTLFKAVTEDESRVFDTKDTLFKNEDVSLLT